MNAPIQTADSLPITTISRADDGTITEAIANADFEYGGLLVCQGAKLSFHACGLLGSILLPGDTLINGILFKGGTTLEYYQSINHPRQGTLAADTWVDQGFAVSIFEAGTDIIFHQNGNVSSGINNNSSNLGGPYYFTLGKGRMGFYPSGFIMSAFNNSEIQFSSTNGTGAISVGYLTFFDPDQNNYSSIASGQFASLTVWNSVPVLARSKVEFFRSSSIRGLGRLRGASLALDTAIQGFLLPQYSWVELYSDGSLRQFDLRRGQTIMGISFTGGSGYVKLYRNGNIEEFMTQYHMNVQGYSIPPYKRTFFLEDGTMVKPLYSTDDREGK